MQKEGQRHSMFGIMSFMRDMGAGVLLQPGTFRKADRRPHRQGGRLLSPMGAPAL